MDGIVCGHIHHPQLVLEQGVLYSNDGDWIENCTTLVETKNGDIRLLKWRDGLNDTEVLAQINWGEKQQSLDECAAWHKFVKKIDACHKKNIFISYIYRLIVCLLRQM